MHRSARNTLARLARARMDDDVFRWEAAEVLRRAVGFDTWCWVLLDPATGLPTRYTATNPVIGHDQRRFFPLVLQSHTTGPPAAQPRPGEVSVLSAATGGALERDPLWREMFGPGGQGDQLGAHLAADGVGWANLTLFRDEDRAWFSPDDAAFIAGVAPMLAARLRAGLRQTPAGIDPAEPGTIIVDGDLTLVTATSHAWRWIDRLGLEKANDADPLPGFIYGMLARLAHDGQPDQTAQVRLHAADGAWVLVRVAPLTGPHVDGGYAITLQAASAADLTDVLMPAWNLSPPRARRRRPDHRGTLQRRHRRRLVPIAAYRARPHQEHLRQGRRPQPATPHRCPHRPTQRGSSVKPHPRGPCTPAQDLVLTDGIDLPSLDGNTERTNSVGTNSARQGTEIKYRLAWARADPKGMGPMRPNAEPSPRSTARVKCNDWNGFSRRSLIVIVRRGGVRSELKEPVAFGTHQLFGAKRTTKTAPPQGDFRVRSDVVVPGRPMRRTKI